jgi:type I restriction enzyme S subunit
MSDELLDLPESWEWKNLGELVLNIQYGYTASATDKPTKIKFLRITDLQENSVDWETVPFCNCSEIDKYKLFPGDIVIARTGATTGKSFLLKQIPETTIFASYLIRLHTSNLCPPEYLALFMQSPKYWKQITTVSKGTAQPGANASILSNLIIPLPPLNEQKRIVAKIEELSDRSQAAQKALETIPQLCDRFRQSVLAAAFRGDLTADWREKNPDVEPASVLLERIKKERCEKWENEELKKFKASGKIPKDDKWKEKYKEPQELEKIDNVELSELPDGWLWMSADKCTSWITDGEHATPERSDSGVYLLSARNVLDGKISLQKVDFISEQVHKKLEERLKIESGDVFLSCSGTVGRSCVVPPDLKCSLVRSVAVLKPLFNMGEYLSLAIRSPCIQAQIEGKKTQTAQSNIFQGRIKILAIPVAPLNEQKQIVSLIEKYFKIIETIEKQHQQATEKLERLNQSILSKAFRGELVPQDIEDEPASVLLERIRAEREKLNNNKPKSTSKRKSKTPKQQGTIPGLE